MEQLQIFHSDYKDLSHYPGYIRAIVIFYPLWVIWTNFDWLKSKDCLNRLESIMIYIVTRADTTTVPLFH